MFPFDVVSMQFCMHYAFESEHKVRTLLENVTRYLRPGGVFVGTIPDAKNLLCVCALALPRLGSAPMRFAADLVSLGSAHSDHLDNNTEAEDPLAFGNAVYSVKFDAREWPSPYGHRYTFFLQDAVEEVPEYVVYWDNFVACVPYALSFFPLILSLLTQHANAHSLAAEYHLSPRYCADFSSIFADEQEDAHFAQLLRRMNVMDAEGNAEMDEDQLDAASECRRRALSLLLGLSVVACWGACCLRKRVLTTLTTYL